MSRFPLALRLASLAGRPDLRTALPAAAHAGFVGVQLDVAGELLPDDLSATGRRQVRHLLDLQRLRMVGTVCPTRRGLDELDRLEARLLHLVKSLRLTADLGGSAMVIHAGPIPAEQQPSNAHFFDAVDRIAREADRLGLRLALHTGDDPPERLANLVAASQGVGLAIQLDPAALVARGQALGPAVAALRLHTVGLDVRDLLRTAGTLSGFREVPPGDGEIDYRPVLAALAEADFRGPAVLEADEPTLTEASLPAALRWWAAR